MSVAHDIQVVTFELSGEIYAVPVGLVREILDYRKPRSIPNAPAHLAGVTDLRGDSVPIIDLRLQLLLPRVEPTSMTRILVMGIPTSRELRPLGLIVDRVIGVTMLRSDRMKPAPDIAGEWNASYIAGIISTDDDFVVMLDIPSMFAITGEVLESAAADL